MPDAVRRFPSLWVDPEDDPRVALGEPRGEMDVLRYYLDVHRFTLELKCDGLSPEQLAERSVSPSPLSLVGLVRHMAQVEHNWFKRVLQCVEAPKLYVTADDPDHDFNGATGTQACVDDAFATWRAEIVDAREYLNSVAPATLVAFRGEQIEVRNALVHVIETYARHCGHADLIRERIDGRTGT